MATLTMVFKLLQSAEKRWISLRGKEKVEEKQQVLAGCLAL